MPLQGYPDYTRLARSGGYQLYEKSGTVPYNTVLFQGYVGLWPYVNLITTSNSSTDHARIHFDYYTDATFSTQNGFRYAIRQGDGFANSQYANLSDWLRVFYDDHTGLVFPFAEFGLYANQGPANQFQLSSLDVPIQQYEASVPASTTVTLFPGHIQPGAGKFYWSSGSATFAYLISYYDYASDSYHTQHRFSNVGMPSEGVIDCPMLDTSYRIQITNSDGAAAHTMRMAWLSA